jgi:pseudouridine-5'-phosphate glycosidase
MVQKRSGGTTVAATLKAASTADIKIFATGGIGGVHRGNPFDVSADLNALAENPVVVVCAGAKSILDLPATLEALDTRGIPVLGFAADEFPAFYTRNSGLKVDARVDDPREVAEIARVHWNTGHRSAILVCNPIPAESELDGEEIEAAIERAVKSATRQKINGANLTPYLLEEVKKVTSGKSLQANLALLKSNAALAADVALHLYHPKTVSF